MGGSFGPQALRTLSRVTERDTKHLLVTPGGAVTAAWAAALLGALSACSGSPSRNILGSYFPSWMVCALLGLAAALAARMVLRASGLLSELPVPPVVLLSIGCATTFALWLLWLA